jgi:hypothetical protein
MDAEQGNAWAKQFIGYMYEKGQGITQNYELALSWYRKNPPSFIDRDKRKRFAIKKYSSPVGRHF